MTSKTAPGSLLTKILLYTRSMLMLRQFTAVLLILGFSISAAWAIETREITWDDLVPAEAEFDDPFTLLDEDTLYELSLIAEVRDRIEAKQEIDDETMANYKQRVSDLEEEGIDVHGLIDMRDQVAAERTAKLQLTNTQLEGQQVKIPGYLLPLEFEGEMVTEFFLVPYVGACIHVPPPPPNQIVHVTTPTPFPLDGGFYTAVWVNGVLRSENANTNLSFIDGASDVPSGYKINAESVKRYE